MNEKLQAVTANQVKLPRKRTASAPTLPDPLRNFNGLPDQAFVRLPVVLMLPLMATQIPPPMATSNSPT